MAIKTHRVLAISSQVVRGTVGLNIAVPCLHALGIEVWPLPTTIMSNHPGLAAPEGRGLEADDMARVAAVLLREGWLNEVSGVLTGYFAGPDQVAAAAGLIQHIKAANPDVIYACDPVIGDEPDGLYVKQSVAEAIRDTLMPMADITTPNLFELGWLTGWSAEGAVAVPRIAQALSPAETLVTSVPGRGKLLHVHAALKTSRGLWAQVRARPRCPHGVGDGFAALYLGYRILRHGPSAALGRTMVGVEELIDRSQGLTDINLARLGQRLDKLEPWPVEVGGFGV